MELVNQWLAQIGVAPLVGAAIIAVATVIAAGLIRILGDRVALALSKWSRLGIRGQLFKIIRLPLWVSVLLIGVLLEVQWLTPCPPLELFIAGAAKTALAIVWMIVLGRTLKLVSSRLGGYYPGAAEFLTLTENVGIAFIAVMTGLAILSIWQINLTPLLASAGIVGIIVGLAAKDTLGNFFGGISVFLDRPFRPGDYLVLNSGERGKVIHVGLRSTRILTRDDVLISVPNSVIVNTKIINESAPDPRMRIRIKVSVAYSSDVDQVEAILLEVAAANSLVLSEPEPRVRFRAFGNSGLDVELLCWTAYPKDKGLLIHQLNSAVFKEFNKVGMVFATPQRIIYMHEVSDEQNDRYMPGMSDQDNKQRPSDLRPQ